MKRYLSSLLALLLAMCGLSQVAFGAVKSDFSTRFRIIQDGSVWNTEWDGTGEEYETVTVEYQLKGNGIKGIQGTWFAVDMQNLLWVGFSQDGKSVQESIIKEELLPGGKAVFWRDTDMWSLKEPITENRRTVDAWSFSGINSTLAALDASGKTLLLCPQPMQACSVFYRDYTTVVSFRFAVLPGATLHEDAVRIITTDEREFLRQSFISAMNDGTSGYYYGNVSAADTLSAPMVFWNLPVDTVPDTQPVTPPMIDPPAGNDDVEPQFPLHPFTDIPGGAAYEDAVVYVYNRGLFNGMSDTTFEPDTSMTRAMFVTVLGRLEGIDLACYSGKSFEDVVENTWYAPYVRWASEKGIVQGYGNGIFGVDDPLTVEQAVVIMARYAEYNGIRTAQKSWKYRFLDEKSVSVWAENAMKWAVKEDIYQGDSGWLTPQAPAKRSLLSQILYAYDTMS